MKVTYLIYSYSNHQIHLVQHKIPNKPRQDEIDAGGEEAMARFVARFPTPSRTLSRLGDVGVVGVIVAHADGNIVWVTPAADRRAHPEREK